MAKISKKAIYPLPIELNGKDYVIGTQAETQKTVNIEIASIVQAAKVFIESGFEVSDYTKIFKDALGEIVVFDPFDIDNYLEIYLNQ